MQVVSVTLSGLLVAAAAFAATPSMGVNVSSQTALDPSLSRNAIQENFRLTAFAGGGTILPACACPVNMTPKVYGPWPYDAGASAACAQGTPSTPNLLGMYLKAVYTCQNGKMYVCQWTEGQGCTSSTKPKPACPANTCVGSI